MKIVYITSYSFPSTKAEPYHVKSLAEALAARIGTNLHLVINGIIPPELEHIQTASIKKKKHFRTVFYLFWFLGFLYRSQLRGKDVVFISNDPYLLLIFIFWKKILRFKYKVCADWHLLFEDWKDNAIAQNCDYMISTTQRLKDITVSKCLVSGDKILVAYGGIDQNLLFKKDHIDKKTIREELGLPMDAFLVGYAGTFQSLGLEKGLKTMIDALPKLSKQTHMVFVGGTREQIPEYEALAHTRGVSDRCIFLGRQLFSKILQYEQAMDLLVIPYPDQHHFRDYGFPIKVWEYMAVGRPILYSNLAIIAEVLNGRGTPFTPDDSASLAEATRFVQDNFLEAEKVSEKNMTDVEQYTWDKKAQRIINFFEQN